MGGAPKLVAGEALLDAADQGVDVTLSELALESFFPADATITQALRALAEAASDTDE